MFCFFFVFFYINKKNEHIKKNFIINYERVIQDKAYVLRAIFVKMFWKSYSSSRTRCFRFIYRR